MIYMKSRSKGIFMSGMRREKIMTHYHNHGLFEVDP